MFQSLNDYLEQFVGDTWTSLSDLSVGTYLGFIASISSSQVLVCIWEDRIEILWFRDWEYQPTDHFIYKRLLTTEDYCLWNAKRVDVKMELFNPHQDRLPDREPGSRDRYVQAKVWINGEFYLQT